MCQGSIPQGSEQTCRRQAKCVPLKVKAGRRRRPTYLGSSGGHRGRGGSWGRQGAAGKVKGHIVLMATQDAGEVHSKGQQCSWIGGRQQPSGHLQERGCRGEITILLPSAASTSPTTGPTMPSAALHVFHHAHLPACSELVPG